MRSEAWECPRSLLEASAPNELVHACGQPERRSPHFICHHRLADFASELLFRESERPVRIGEELDNLQLNGDRFRGCARSHASIGLGVATLRGIAVLGTLRTLTITS